MTQYHLPGETIDGEEYVSLKSANDLLAMIKTKHDAELELARRVVEAARTIWAYKPNEQRVQGIRAWSELRDSVEAYDAAVQREG